MPQHTEVSGYSISFNPTSFLTACFAPSAVAGAFPTVSVVNASGSREQKTHVPAVLRADDLFIRCDDAVFSGTQIHARLLDAVVTNNVTIEDLLNEFHEEARDASFSTSLHGLFSLTQGFGISSSSHSNSSSLPHYTSFRSQ